MDKILKSSNCSKCENKEKYLIIQSEEGIIFANACIENDCIVLCRTVFNKKEMQYFIKAIDNLLKLSDNNSESKK